MTTASKPSILRGIGRWDLVALMVNISIGSGILGLPGRLFELTQMYSLLVLVLCAALMGVIAICFAEAASRYVDSGGPYLLTRNAFGPAPGFIVGWLYWVSRVLTFATICNLLVDYFGRFAPALQGEGPRVVVISLVVGAITIIHLLGIRHATVVGNALTVVKVSFLVVFGLAGVWNAEALFSVEAPVPAAGDISAAMLLAIFAFTGFEAAIVGAGEMRNPRRDIPFAIAASLLVILLLYLGVLAVCIAKVPLLAESKTPLADAAVAMWGPLGAQITAAAAMVIMLGSLNGGFIATTRLPFAFAEQGDAPAVLARVHAKFRTPYVAILGCAVIVLVATLASSFLSAITLATSTRMVVYISGCVALLALRRRQDAPPAQFIAPAGRWFAVIAITLSTGLLATASGNELLQLAISTVIGVMLYFTIKATAR
jgi:APA family basic amino acid/polyamine antiporter